MGFAPPAGIPGIGIDLVEVERLGESLERGGQALRDRMFTAAEQEECARRRHPNIHLAARMAAKEAAMKVVGTGWTDGVGFHDFEVVSDGKTPPTLNVSGRARELLEAAGVEELRVSLSHTDQLAVAMVVAVPRG